MNEFTLHDQTIMFAFYIRNEIDHKIAKPNRQNLNNYFREKGEVKEFDRVISVSAETVENMLKSILDGTLFKTKQEKLLNMAILFECKYRTVSEFWNSLQIQKENRDKLIQALKTYKGKLEGQPSQVELKRSPSVRKLKGVQGLYRGTSVEPTGNFSFQFELQPSEDKAHFIGTGNIHYIIPTKDMDEYHDLRLTGKLLHGDLLMLEYYNRDQNKKHCGSILFKVANSGNILYGLFLGHGYPFGGTVTGGVTVQKADLIY